MNLTLSITPDTVSIGKQSLSKELTEQIALHSRVVDNTQEGQLIVDFDVKKAFLLPASEVFKNWKLISKKKS